MLNAIIAPINLLCLAVLEESAAAGTPEEVDTALDVLRLEVLDCVTTGPTTGVVVLEAHDELDALLYVEVGYDP